MTSIDLDGYAWATEQADALRRRSTNEIDWDALAEEVEYLAGSHLRELRNRYVVLLVHLLKWVHQPSFRGRSWRNTLAEQRKRISLHLQENPSLKGRDQEQYLKAYELARLVAERETGLEARTFPATPPFSREQALTDDWLPAED